MLTVFLLNKDKDKRKKEKELGFSSSGHRAAVVCPHFIYMR